MISLFQHTCDKTTSFPSRGEIPNSSPEIDLFPAEASAVSGIIQFVDSRGSSVALSAVRSTLADCRRNCQPVGLEPPESGAVNWFKHSLQSKVNHIASHPLDTGGQFASGHISIIQSEL